MSPVTIPSESPLSDQLKLAQERTYLAAERTLMAWIRTATSLITFGFTLYKFFLFLREQGQAKTAGRILGPRDYGLIMMSIGVVMLALATCQHLRFTKRLRREYAEMPWSLSAILAALIACLGVLGIVEAIVRP